MFMFPLYSIPFSSTQSQIKNSLLPVELCYLMLIKWVSSAQTCSFSSNRPLSWVFQPPELLLQPLWASPRLNGHVAQLTISLGARIWASYLIWALTGMATRGGRWCFHRKNASDKRINHLTSLHLSHYTIYWRHQGQTCTNKKLRWSGRRPAPSGEDIQAGTPLFNNLIYKWPPAFQPNWVAVWNIVRLIKAIAWAEDEHWPPFNLQSNFGD